jgi:hypothetical protein
MDVVNGSALGIKASKGGKAVIQNDGANDVTINCKL